MSILLRYAYFVSLIYCKICWNALYWNARSNHIIICGSLFAIRYYINHW